ncbi:hypothetical protein [Methanosarcina mazei]|uniref:hypothetical protein n=1 Tax=Methanosarcina mazei TaxID=2209 RepID=UPI000ABFDACF|nr:hypothetical protein [Methanosarcina mazei]
MVLEFAFNQDIFLSACNPMKHRWVRSYKLKNTADADKTLESKGMFVTRITKFNFIQKL